MNEMDKRAVDEMKANVQCGKDFQCLENDFENLCKARDMGLEGYVECIDDEGLGCHFSLPFGNSFFCSCPIRVYLIKKNQ
jgi:hypothetical protein